MSEVEEEVNEVEEIQEASNGGNKTQANVTDYIALVDQREHILLRPNVYIGSVNSREQWVDIFDNGKISKQNITTPAALERAFLEVLSNAVDNVTRSRANFIDPGVIEVAISKNFVTVTNYGYGIPVKIHPESGWMLPKLIFGKLLSGSNYDDEKGREGSGVNGLGVKLVNIFSSFFQVTIGDNINQKKYTGTWKNNMLIYEETIVDYERTETNFVSVKYKLDFRRFGYINDGYNENDINLFIKHCIDASFTIKIPIAYNGAVLEYSSILDYARLFLKDEDVDKKYILHYIWPANLSRNNITVANSGEEIGYTPESTEEHKFRVLPIFELCVFDMPDNGKHAAFCNGIINREGGTHVDDPTREINNVIKNIFANANTDKKGGKGKKAEKSAKAPKESKNKEDKKTTRVTITHIKPHIFTVVSYRCVNPEFNTQEKPKLLSKIPKIVFNDAAVKSIRFWDLVERIRATIYAINFKKHAKNKKNKFIITTAMDANKAGKESHNCVLMIIEGKSASAYVKNLLEYLPGGRNYWGVLPIRGKIINVTNRTLERSLANKEIAEICKLLGIEPAVDYSTPENFNTLRYHKVMFVADSDVDGIHINNLLANDFFRLFTNLVQRNIFYIMRTPIIRVTKGKNSLKFYTRPAYDKWAIENKTGWKLNFFKGLASSSKEDVFDDSKNIFVVNLLYNNNSEYWFNLAFNKLHIHLRKQWLEQWEVKTNHETNKELTYSHYISDELIEYSRSNLIRSIPGFDGMKEVQRKILWTALTYTWKINAVAAYKKVKVGDFASNTSSYTHYEHGPTSLEKAIIKMAQDYVGAYNLPYFTPDGQFGTRFDGGTDAGASRYLHTRPQKWLKYCYMKEDHNLYVIPSHGDEEYEPNLLLPIIPVHLINGACGIATGYSTYIPPHNPDDIIKWLINKLEGTRNKKLIPWWRGFKGPMEFVDKRLFKDNVIVMYDGVQQVQTRAFTLKKSKPILATAALPLNEILKDRDEEADEEEDEEADAEAVDDEAGEDDEDAEEEAEEKAKNIDEAAVEASEYNIMKQQCYITTRGNYNQDDNLNITITELPIGVQSGAYEQTLMDWRAQKKIKDYDTDSKSETVYFKIYAPAFNANYKTLGLERSYSLTNMLLIDKGRPVKYDSAEHILESFYTFRIPYYHKRKENMLLVIAEKLKELYDRIKLLTLILDGKIEIRNVKKADVFLKLDEYELPHELVKKVTLINQSWDDVTKFKEEIVEMELELERLKNTTIENMWITDLKVLLTKV